MRQRVLLRWNKYSICFKTIFQWFYLWQVFVRQTTEILDVCCHGWLELSLRGEREPHLNVPHRGLWRTKHINTVWLINHPFRWAEFCIFNQRKLLHLCLCASISSHHLLFGEAINAQSGDSKLQRVQNHVFSDDVIVSNDGDVSLHHCSGFPGEVNYMLSK